MATSAQLVGQPDLQDLAIRLAQQQQAPPPGIAAPLQLPDQAKPDLSIGATPHPQVIAPRGTIQGDQAERSRMLSTGAGEDQIQGKLEGSQFGQVHPVAAKILGGLGQGLAKLGDVGLSAIAPALAINLPGTEYHHMAELHGLNKQIGSEEGEQEKEAQTAGFQQQGDLHEQQARAAELTPTTEEESTALGVPIGTMLNAASRAALTKQSGINSTKVKTTEMTVQGRQDVADANNLTKEKVSSLKPEQRDDRAIRLMEKPPEARTQEENAYLGAYSKWVDQTKIQPGVQRMMALAQFRPVQVLGPDGEVHYDYSGHAIKSGASSPQSMNFRTALGMSKFMTSGQGGQTITAYNTANDHLELLGKAMDALQNGDVQGLNQLSNAFKQQFGSAAPTNVNAVKAMLAGELANIAKVTGATDQEIKVQQENINRAASPEQIKGFIDENHDLMDQKAFEMYQQYQTGMQGKPAFGTGRPIKGPNGQQPAATGGGRR